MATKLTVRTLDAYSLHGHVGAGSDTEDLLDYSQFFATLANADFRVTRFQVGGDTVAITESSTRSGRIAIRFVTGNARELPLVYDEATGLAEQVDPGVNRFVVAGVWVIVDPEKRIVIIERKRPGVPVFQIERFLSQFGRSVMNLPGLTISLNPVPSASFIEEIQAFTRIREASITLRRPNHSWTASAQGMIGELTESNASEIQIQLNADRGQSLSKSTGVVSEIIDLARNAIGPLKNALIKGTTRNFEGERTVSLLRHTVKGTARVDTSEGAIAQLESIDPVANDLISEALTGFEATTDSDAPTS